MFRNFIYKLKRKLYYRNKTIKYEFENNQLNQIIINNKNKKVETYVFYKPDFSNMN